MGCIVTEKALENIGIEKNEINKISHISWDLSYGSGTHKITIPISGVVKKLRSNYKILLQKFFSSMNTPSLSQTLSEETTKQCYLFRILKSGEIINLII